MVAAKEDHPDARVVIAPSERLDGSAMQQASGAVRDMKLIYPETGFDAMTLCLGVVEIDPGHHSPLHRHRCEEVYYVVRGSGELESNGHRYSLTPGSRCSIAPGWFIGFSIPGARRCNWSSLPASCSSRSCRPGRRPRPTRSSRAPRRRTTRRPGSRRRRRVPEHVQSRIFLG